MIKKNYVDDNLLNFKEMRQMFKRLTLYLLHAFTTHLELNKRIKSLSVAGNKAGEDLKNTSIEQAFNGTTWQKASESKKL